MGGFRLRQLAKRVIKGQFECPVGAKADPKQTGDAQTDLINQRQIPVPFGVLDFMDAEGVDLAERPVFQTSSDDMFDRVEHLVPGCTKGFRRLFP
jgi:hypothetical protein